MIILQNACPLGSVMAFRAFNSCKHPQREVRSKILVGRMSVPNGLVDFGRPTHFGLPIGMVPAQFRWVTPWVWWS
jgi:hypothetical protein